MTSLTADAVVIGCGGFGSAAACHLAGRGLRVVGVDRFLPPHDRGSSHGETRVIRKAYFEHPDYIPLLDRAEVLWQQLHQQNHAMLYERCGLLLAGPADGEVIAGTRAAKCAHQLPIETLSRADAERQFAQFRFPEDCDIEYEADAGFLWSERCIAAHLASATADSAQFFNSESVRSIATGRCGVSVTTERRTISAAMAIVAAGAWTGSLLPDYADRIRILRKTLFWLPCHDPVWASESCPIHLFELPHGMFYGFPCVDAATVKLGEHSGGEPVDDVERLRRDVTDGDARPVEDYAARHLRGVGTPNRRSSVCMYSMSPDGHFLFDFRPDESLIVAAGFSGHGFKFTSVLGEAIADLVVTGRTELPVEFLSSDRLTRRHQP